MFFPSVIDGGRVDGMSARSPLESALFHVQVLELEKKEILDKLKKEVAIGFYSMVANVILFLLSVFLGARCLLNG